MSTLHKWEEVECYRTVEHCFIGWKLNWWFFSYEVCAKVMIYISFLYFISNEPYLLVILQWSRVIVLQNVWRYFKGVFCVFFPAFVPASEKFLLLFLLTSYSSIKRLLHKIQNLIKFLSLFLGTSLLFFLSFF